MNLVIWSSPAKKTHIFFGVANGAPSCIQYEQHCKSGEHPGLQSLAWSRRVHLSFSDSALRLRMRGGTGC